MIDNLDFGARDSYPSMYNYNYASSMYLDSSTSPQGAVRAYTEDTRASNMEGCEPCRGFSSVYYDKCYAKEGNQCVGRSYPQCQRGDPFCPQMGDKELTLYKISNGTSEVVDEDEDILYTDKFSQFSVGGKRKDNFSIGDYEITDQRVILIAIIFVCLIMLMNGNSKNKKTDLPYTYTFVGDGYSPYIYS